MCGGGGGTKWIFSPIVRGKLGDPYSQKKVGGIKKKKIASFESAADDSGKMSFVSPNSGERERKPKYSDAQEIAVLPIPKKAEILPQN